MDKITKADIIAYAEEEWERRVANVSEGMKATLFHLAVTKTSGGAAKLQTMWSEEKDSPPQEQG